MAVVWQGWMLLAVARPTRVLNLDMKAELCMPKSYLQWSYSGPKGRQAEPHNHIGKKKPMNWFSHCYHGQRYCFWARAHDDDDNHDGDGVAQHGAILQIIGDGPLEKWWGGRGKNQKKIHAREIAKKKNSCKEEGKEKKFMQKEGPGPGPVAMAWRHLSVRLLSSQEFWFAIIAFNKRNCVL